MDKEQRDSEFYLLEIFQKIFDKRDKAGNKTGEQIHYLEIWLSDRGAKRVFRVKPYNTAELTTVLPRLLEYRGLPVVPEYKNVWDAKLQIEVPRLIGLTPLKSPNS